MGFELKAVLTSSIEEYAPHAKGKELVHRAIEKPVGLPRLLELATYK